MDLGNLNRIAEEVIEEIAREKGQALSSCRKTIESCESLTNEGEFDAKLAAVMEHSMIRPDATPAMVKQFCDEAIKYKFRNVALAPCFVSMAAKLLRGTGVKVSTAVAFPMGITTTKMKVAETLEVIENGATEIDLPINVGMVKAGDLKSIKEDIEAVIAAADGRALIKAVVDLGALSDEEKVKVSLTAKVCGTKFLKVAAGSRAGGVTATDIKFIRRVVGPEMGLKADGGIKDYKSAMAVLEAGATTIGASGSVKIVSRV